MHKHLTAMLAAGVLIAGGGLAFSHESFWAQYDINKPAVIEGIVTTIDWDTPSSFLTMEGTGANGRLAEFRVDLGRARALEHKGWTRDTVKEGETVTVIGWYARSAFELASGTAAGALGWQVYMYWASVTQRPGLENQPLAQVDPLIFWTVGTLVSAILLGVPSVAGYLARHVRDRQSEQPGT